MAIGGIVASIINAADPGKSGKHYLQKGAKLWDDLETPDYENLIAPYLQSAGQLSPETYDAQISGTERNIQEDPGGELAQLRNLGRLEGIAQEGLPLQDMLMAQQSQRALASEGGRAREAVMADMVRRGRGGSGAELAAKLATTGDQEAAAGQRGSDLAMMAIQNRLAGIGELGGQLGQFRGQNISKEAQISNISNQYNQWLSGLNTTAAANAARTKNAAQQYNLANDQRIADTNVMGNYQNLLQKDSQAQMGFQDTLAKIGGQTGQLDKLSNMQMALSQQKQDRVSGAGAGVDSLIGTGVGSYLGKKPG